MDCREYWRMLELLFWLMLVDLVLGNGNGRRSRVKIMVSLTGRQAVYYDGIAFESCEDERNRIWK
jgi:hypothetical protein